MRSTILLLVTQVALGTPGQPEYADLDSPPTLEPVEDTVRHVFILARGGSRVPIFNSFPKDNVKWKRGKGELLEHGKRLMTALGTSLYSRYGEAMRRSESKARSLSCDQTHRANQSAALLAVQLFKDKGYTVLEDKDIGFIDTSEMISQPESKVCPRYRYERTRTYAWEQLLSNASKVDDDNDLYPRMDEIKGLTGLRGLVTKLDLMKIWDTLYMQRVALRSESGQSPAAWVDELLRWKDMTGETYDLVTGGDRYLTEEFTAGPFFHRLLQELSTPGETLGVSVHVSHSLLLSAVLASLGLHMFKPHVGTALIFELHHPDLVRVLLYQPLDWTAPGQLHQAKGRSPMVTALQGLCSDWDFNADVTPYTCPLNKFRAKLPCLSHPQWVERCSQVG